MSTSTRIARNIIKDQRGSIMIEFAGSIIILLVIYLGMITLGLRIADYSAVQKVARDGAREVAISGSIAQAENRARQSAWLWGLKPEKLSVNFNTFNFGSRTLSECDVTYKSSPFSSTFPTLVKEEPVDEKELHGKATFGWWDAN